MQVHTWLQLYMQAGYERSTGYTGQIQVQVVQGCALPAACINSLRPLLPPVARAAAAHLFYSFNTNLSKSNFDVYNIQ